MISKRKRSKEDIFQDVNEFPNLSKVLILDSEVGDSENFRTSDYTL